MEVRRYSNYLSYMAKKKLDFAAMYHELEELSSWFERGEPDLDIGMEKFARAQEIMRLLQERLSDAEQVIRRIRVTGEPGAVSPDDGDRATML